MAWSVPITWVANVTAITAARLNTDLRDNLNYLKGLLDGTGSDTVNVPSTLVINNDILYHLQVNGGNPRILVDTGDLFAFIRASNDWRFITGGADTLTISGAGKLTGTGFYDSGATAIGTSTTVDVAHGLGARPRFVFGYWTTAGAAALDPASATNVNAMEGPDAGTNL